MALVNGNGSTVLLPSSVVVVVAGVTAGVDGICGLELAGCIPTVGGAFGPDGAEKSGNCTILSSAKTRPSMKLYLAFNDNGPWS